MTKKITRRIIAWSIPVAILAALIGGSVTYGTFCLFLASQVYYLYALKD